MAQTTKDLTTLKIHKLTQAQYDQALAEGLINDNELYLTPEEFIQADYAQNDSSKSDYIKNRPFSVFSTNTLEWNGDSDGKKVKKETVDGIDKYWVLVYSTSPVWPDDFEQGGTFTQIKDGAPVTIEFTQSDISPYYSMEIYEPTETLKYYTYNNDDVFRIASDGIWFFTDNKINQDNYTKSLTINGYTGFNHFEQLDSEYLPMSAIKKVMFDYMYPVGHILMTTNAANPSTYMGGEWIAWGAGRVPVGVDQSDEAIRDVDFASAELMGGEKTHELIADELPSHNHSIPALNGYTYYEAPDGMLLNGDGYHNHTLFKYINNRIASGNDASRIYGLGRQLSEEDEALTSVTSIKDTGGHTHTIRTNASTTGSKGSGEAHNNLQPYITCYMWKRTA